MPQRSRGRRTDYNWTGFITVGLTIAESNTNTLGGSLTFNDAATIYRLRGQLLIRFDGTSAGDTNIAGVGIIVVQESAVAAGAASVPNPLTDPEADFLWHQYAPFIQPVTDDVGGVSSSMRIEVDSKAMRRVKDTQTLQLVASMSAATGATTLTGGIRILTGK